MLNRLLASRQRPCFRHKGPWDTLVFDLSGNQLEITLPPQDYEFAEEDHGKRFNLFDAGFYKYKTEPDKNGYPAHHKGVSRNPLWRRNWETFGRPWEFQHIGSLQSAAVVCDIARMPAALNCFNPEQMERLIMHLLYYSDGPGFMRTNEANSPVNWQVKNLHGTEWIYCESWPRKPTWEEYSQFNDESCFTAWLITPLFADKYLLLSFSATGSLPAAPSNQLMQERIAQIIPNIKLRLSAEAAQQQAAARQRFPNSRYSPARQPEPWQYYEFRREGDTSKGEPYWVLDGSCSPPPPLY